MGHYDDAREAHEEREETVALERKAKQFRDLIVNRSDRELGQLLAQYECIADLAGRMNGTADQHRSLQSYRGRVTEFYRRRT